MRRMADNDDYQSFISDANGNYSQVMFTLYVDGGNDDCGATDQFAFYDGNSAHCSGVTATVGTWYHIAVSRDSGGTRRFFVDGVLVSTETGTVTPADSNGVLSFGRPGSFNGEYFTGTLDEIRVSDIALYTANFSPPTAPLPSSANTVGLWHLDEGTGQVAADSSSNGRDGTLGSDPGPDSADPTWVADSPVGGP